MKRLLTLLLACTIGFLFLNAKTSFAADGLVYCEKIAQSLSLNAECTNSCPDDLLDLSSIKNQIPASSQYMLNSLCEGSLRCCAYTGEELCTGLTAGYGSCERQCGADGRTAVKADDGASFCGGSETCCIDSNQVSDMNQALSSRLDESEKVVASEVVAEAEEEEGTGDTNYGLINPLGSRTISDLTADVVKWISSLAGTAFIVYLFWGGLQWMTSRGDPKQLMSARGKMLYAIVGITVIFTAYFIIDALISVTNIGI
jgi:hypothetical protein